MIFTCKYLLANVLLTIHQDQFEFFVHNLELIKGKERGLPLDETGVCYPILGAVEADNVMTSNNVNGQ